MEERIKGSMIITPKDIQIITGKHYSKALVEHELVRDALGKPKHGKLTIKEYCEYFQLNYQEVITHLNNHR